MGLNNSKRPAAKHRRAKASRWLELRPCPGCLLISGSDLRNSFLHFFPSLLQFVLSISAAAQGEAADQLPFFNVSFYDSAREERKGQLSQAVVGLGAVHLVTQRWDFALSALPRYSWGKCHIAHREAGGWHAEIWVSKFSCHSRH